ncbi:FixH family protein [Allopontixanthobacter sp.]|uniref:FixH family protein n=1 Tax=Allopontixanthobacter sp. TaxID=2906452 RepID=UPI002ABBD2E8|nr:FixH family protein [Allopontixanthobacter sp.]MDZ4308676.1 FixH family protein [Allopontixanthobacter sp.]
MSKPFTGRHMWAVMICGFGVVIGVNFFMATLAVRGFGGVVVENSYVASQKFNGWLSAAREQEQLGWSAQAVRQADGNVRIVTAGVPAGADVSARFRRPLGKPETLDLDFNSAAPGEYVSSASVPSGRWIARIAILTQDDRWTGEVRIE